MCCYGLFISPQIKIAPPTCLSLQVDISRSNSATETSCVWLFCSTANYRLCYPVTCLSSCKSLFWKICLCVKSKKTGTRTQACKCMFCLHLYLCLCACVRACVPVCLSVCLSVSLSVCLSIYLSVCLSTTYYADCVCVYILYQCQHSMSRHSGKLSH